MNAHGVGALLPFDTAAVDLLATLRLVAHGLRVRGDSTEVTTPLTPSEWRVLELLRRGQSNKEISAQLHVSTETTKSHVKQILRKLGVRSRNELLTHSWHVSS